MAHPLFRPRVLLTLVAWLGLGCGDSPEIGEAEPPSRATTQVEESPGFTGRVETPSDPPSTEEIAQASASELAKQPPRTDWRGGRVGQGAAVYARYCVTCHGSDGRGDGPAAAALNPKPRDFTAGDFYFDANGNGRTGEPIDLARIVLHGPAAFGGSPTMQAWDEALTQDEVRDVVAFLRSLSGAGGAGSASGEGAAAVEGG